MDIQKINSVITKLKEAIKEIEKSENVSFNLGNIKYTDLYFKIPIEVVEISDKKKIEINNLLVSKKLGFTQNVIGMKFEFDGFTYKITEFKTNNRKYPIIAIRSGTTKSYKFSVSSIKRHLGGDKIINRNANLDKI